MPLPAPMTSTTLARQFIFRRHATELGFFQRPVFNIEGFLPRQRDIVAYCFRPAQDRHGATIELGCDARFAFVFAVCDHAQSGDQNHSRIWVANWRAIRMFASFVVSAVIGTITFNAASQLVEHGIGVFRPRIPIDIERLDFGAQEVIGTRGAQFGQSSGIDAVDEA